MPRRGGIKNGTKETFPDDSERITLSALPNNCSVLTSPCPEPFFDIGHPVRIK